MIVTMVLLSLILYPNYTHTVKPKDYTGWVVFQTDWNYDYNGNTAIWITNGTDTATMSQSPNKQLIFVGDTIK